LHDSPRSLATKEYVDAQSGGGGSQWIHAEGSSLDNGTGDLIIIPYDKTEKTIHFKLVDIQKPEGLDSSIVSCEGSFIIPAGLTSQDDTPTYTFSSKTMGPFGAAVDEMRIKLYGNNDPITEIQLYIRGKAPADSGDTSTYSIDYMVVPSNTGISADDAYWFFGG